MIFTVILHVILSIVGILLTPIDFLISTLIPNLGSYTANIVNFFGSVTNYLGWAMSAIGINAIVATLLVGFWTFKLTAPAFVWVFKLVFKWYRTLKA